MGISISNVAGELKTIEVEFGGEKANVVVRPGEFTPELEADVTAVGGISAGFVELLSRVVESWEVLDDNGQPIAPTPENLRKLPSFFLVEVARQVGEGLAPKARTA